MIYRSAIWVCFFLFNLTHFTYANEVNRINIDAGSSFVIPAPSIKRIAIGNGNIVQASAVNGKEVLVFGKSKGSTTLEIWMSNGKRKSYLIIVNPEGIKRIHEELNILLKSIPNATAIVAGDKVVIQGEDLSDADRIKISSLSSLYPEVIDFTSQQGWDRMVMLDVQVIELPSTRMQELGIRWDSSSTGGMQTGVAWESSSSSIHNRPGNSALDLNYPAKNLAGMFGVNALLSSRIAALTKSGEAVILAQPQLLARNGSTASFLAGGEVPYAAVDKDGRSTTVFRKYGVSLNITPHADRSGSIRSKLDIEVSSVDSTIAVPGGPALKVRRASTEFNVRSGQTLVVGGFLSRDRSVDREGLPGLSEISLFGKLFGVERDQIRQTELAIFVTPVVVDADDPGLSSQIHRGKSILKDAFNESPRLINELNSKRDGAPNVPSASLGNQWEHIENTSDHMSISNELPSSVPNQWED